MTTKITPEEVRGRFSNLYRNMDKAKSSLARLNSNVDKVVEQVKEISESQKS